MKKRSLLLGSALVPFATAAFAATCATPPDGFPNVTVDANQTQINIIYDDFILEGGGTLPGTFTMSCAATTTEASGPGYRVYSADVRTSGVLEEGQRYRLARDGDEWVVIEGPFADDDAQIGVGYVGLGPNEDLDLDLLLTLETGTGPDALAVVDSVDLFQFASVSEEELQDSLDDVARSTTAALTHLSASAGLLLGTLDPLEGEDSFGAVAAAGSFLVGVNGRMNLGSGLSVFGGAALFQQDAGTSTGGLLLATGMRYIGPDTQGIRFFGEAGAWGSPYMSMAFARSYENGGGYGIDPSTVSTTGAATGMLATAYGKAGMLVDIDAANQLALYGSLSGGIFAGAFDETADPANVFAINSGGAITSATAKLGASWTIRPTEELDLTATAAIGATTGGLAVDVAYAGEQTGSSGVLMFAEGGLRVGYNVTDQMELSAFVLGTTGPQIGTHAQLGGSLSVKF